MRPLLCRLSIALTLLGACSGGRSAAASGEVTPAKPADDPRAAFYVDFLPTDVLSEAIARAEAEDKLIFVDFYTTWCLPCRLMDEDVFTDPEFGRYMNERFVSLKVDAEKGNGVNLAAVYDVAAYPTLLFLDTNGRVRARKQGAAYQTELRRLGDEALRSTP